MMSMASAFEGVVKSVVRELDHSGDLIPVDSLRSSTGFQPYCLLGRKPSSLFWRHRYKCVNLSIRDILEPNAPEPGQAVAGRTGDLSSGLAPAVEHGGPVHFHDTVDGRLKGSVELTTPGQGRLEGEASVSGSSSASMNVCTLRVAPSTWQAMHQERRLRQPEHKVLQQLRNRGIDVFVVTEVLQTQNEVEVTRTHRQEGSGQFALPGALCLQGQGQGHLSRRKTVTIPPGSILAFQVAQLVIGSDWDILLFPKKKQRTFGPPQADPKPSRGAGGQAQRTSDDDFKSIPPSDCILKESDGPAEGWLVATKDFQGLQTEVRAQARGLESLCKELCEQLLGGLGQVLRDELALQALEELLEQGLCCGRVEPLDGPVGAVLECLVHSSRMLEKELACPISYLLGTLDVLNETQHVLLAEVLETGALLEQFKLVGSLLEQSSPWQRGRAVSLLPGLLGSSWGPEAPAWVLLEECGLELQVGAPQVCWEPEAQGRTCALYACLAMLYTLHLPGSAL
ncbi:gasdermin-D isoform X2 [Diceros bicornis minor]|uniref:gasdermin-D isoform X2 n=1 Tax=Diceros bicornis minor TaxID=77932 RepID=UPI0026F1B666|nr:gasdermin-D isoform X2 [Diceros bicornis minor]